MKSPNLIIICNAHYCSTKNSTSESSPQPRGEMILTVARSSSIPPSTTNTSGTHSSVSSNRFVCLIPRTIVPSMPLTLPSKSCRTKILFKENLRNQYNAQLFTSGKTAVTVLFINGMPHLFWSLPKILGEVKSPQISNRTELTMANWLYVIIKIKNAKNLAGNIIIIWFASARKWSVQQYIVFLHSLKGQLITLMVVHYWDFVMRFACKYYQQIRISSCAQIQLIQMNQIDGQLVAICMTVSINVDFVFQK